MGFWKNKRVAVLGGSGFIGSHLTESLVAKGADVTITVRSKDTPHIASVKPFAEKINFVEADLLDAEACKKAISGSQIVINAAGVDGGSKFKREHPFKIFYSNSLIALNVVSALKNVDFEHLIQFSSASVYYTENLHQGIPTEQLAAFPPLDVSYAYSWSKLFSELVAKFPKATDSKSLVVRPNNVFGPRDLTDKERLRLIPYLIDAIASKKNIKLSGPGNQLLSFIYVTDFASNLLKVIEQQKKPFETVNLGSIEEVSMRDLCQLIARLMKVNIDFAFDQDTSPPIRRAIDMTYVMENYHFKQGVPLKEGLKKLLASRNYLN